MYILRLLWSHANFHQKGYAKAVMFSGLAYCTLYICIIPQVASSYLLYM